MRLHGYSTNQRTATPYEQHTKNDARAEIYDGGCPVTLVAQHPEVVGKGGESGEAPQKPVMSNTFSLAVMTCAFSNRPKKSPMMKHPIMLTRKVPIGKLP